MSDTPNSPFKGTTGVRRIINACGYSLAGLRAAWQHEAAFRQVALLAAVSCVLALSLSLPFAARALLIACSLLMLIIELFNSAIEAVVDYISLERHPLAKRAKDMGSAAQLVGLVNLAAVWAVIVYGVYLS